MENKNKIENITNEEFTEAESKNQMLLNEEDIIQGLIDSASFRTSEQKLISIRRDGKVKFTFRIQPLSEADYEVCKKKNTKYVRNKRLGIKMPEDTNGVGYGSSLIYEATIEEDRKLLWDNKKVWTAFRAAGNDIVTATDVIDTALMAGEKRMILDEIDKLSGYDENELEEVVKN